MRVSRLRNPPDDNNSSDNIAWDNYSNNGSSDNHGDNTADGDDDGDNAADDADDIPPCVKITTFGCRQTNK